MTKLPIEQVLPTLQAVLCTQTNAVLVAEPGAGKTTRVPMALMNEAWLQDRRILMLEPRRLAARAAARYMASSLGEQVGQTVGYRVRRDTRVGPDTRIEVITEGVLTRLLQDDPGLENVGAVIFDEFHERSIQADLGLALCLESQSVLRPDLRLLVMSATLEVEPIAKILGGAPVIKSEGRTYPVETRYIDRPLEGRIETAVVRAVVKALDDHEGDILVFLPGAGEIRRVEESLAQCIHDSIMIAPLYGNLPLEAQDKAVVPSKAGQRKVVLATAIAETSLTVEGVRIVIDSGLARVPRFSPRTGMTRLETVMVSRASADQRRGRAGRLGPGICYRLWTTREDHHLVPHTTPEILETDLASLALELAVWGARDPAELSWLDLPPAAAFAQARELLTQLGALSEDGTVTLHGRHMAESGLHPRLAHMILTAIPIGLGGLACELAALISERDILKGNGGQPEADLRLRVDALRRYGAGKEYYGTTHSGYDVDITLCRRIAFDVDYLKRHFGIAPEGHDDADACGLLLAFAYPDRIAQLRNAGRFLMRNGRGAIISQHQSLAEEPYLVAAELEDQGVESRIYLAAPVDKSDLERFFAGQIVESIDVSWDRKLQAVRGRTYRRLGAIILQELLLTDIDRDQCQAALIEGIEEEGLNILPWTKAAVRLKQRMAFMHRVKPDWPDVSDEGLEKNLAGWLGPYLYDVRSRDDLQQLNMVEILASLLTWEQRKVLDEQAPAHILVPSGQRVAIDYSDPSAPVLAVRLQEMFGLTATPYIAGGKVALTLHLLSPAHRPVQVTKDLESFWRNTYFDVKRDLAGRYPKHYWPDNPLTASPTHRVKPRS